MFTNRIDSNCNTFALQKFHPKIPTVLGISNHSHCCHAGQSFPKFSRAISAKNPFFLDGVSLTSPGLGDFLKGITPPPPQNQNHEGTAGGASASQAPNCADLKFFGTKKTPRCFFEKTHRFLCCLAYYV